MKGICRAIKAHTLLSCLILIALLVVSVVLGVALGSVTIPFGDVWRVMLHRVLDLFGAGDRIDLGEIRESTQNIVWFLRAPRVILGMLVGAGLTLSGVGMQAFTKNPLAEPYVLGISSGASLGAVLAMIVGVYLPIGRLSISRGAFMGALTSILLVYALAKSRDGITPIRLVLVGVAVSSLCSAMTNYIVYTAPDDAAVREATFWMLGGLGSAKWTDLPPLAVLIAPCFVAMLAMAKPLNAMMMGDSSAVTLGVNLNLVRKLLILITALLTATSVAVSGCIGFVGLVMPHMARMIAGPNHRRLLPAAMFSGAIFLLLADLVARTLLSPIELSIGVVTSLVGAVAFVVIFYRTRKAG